MRANWQTLQFHDDYANMPLQNGHMPGPGRHVFSRLYVGHKLVTFLLTGAF